MNILNQAQGENWTLANGDCIEVLKSLPENSIHLSIFSPPYASLYTYSNSDRDLGNSINDDQFYEHFAHVVAGLHRVTKPGRIVCVDVMNIPAMKERDGYIGLKDFRGDVIRAFQKAGFIFHSEHCAWKDPLIEATRTKALGLMHKQLCKDSTRSRAGIPQYLLAFRKDGENPEPVAHIDGLTEFCGENPPIHGNLSHERWRRYASPVWMDINFSNTLNAKAARDNEDERHVCPMALDLIERAIQLWSNPGDVVFDPFSGVGSTGYQAIKMGRRFVGSELKQSYFAQACKNIESAKANQGGLFMDAE
ncbi:MAG TPA: DNA methyltransferase [Mycobacterium sp.]|nr:DNA methyltransferase [Nitrospira sp.]HON48751.1 DNA methyltransferase [Kiritimatiellia bacterium]HRD14097.1 DNA methyltransferase [Mycobacterium sp.]